MRSVVSEFRAALTTALANPAHALLVTVATVVSGITGIVIGLIPLLGPLVNGVVLTPALLVATLGSAHAVRNGGTAFDGAGSALKRAGVDVMGAYALLVALYIGASMLVGIVFAAVFVAVGVSGAGELSGVSTAVAVIAAVLGIAVALVILAVAMALQFVAPAAVSAGTGPLESLKTSGRFFRQNLFGVTGFSLVLAGFGVVAVLLIALFYAVGQAIDPQVGLVAAVIGYLVAALLIGTVTPLYQLGYFEATVSAECLPPDHEWPGDGDGGGADADAFAVGEVSTATDEEPTDGFDIEMTADDDTDEESVGWGNSGWDDESR